MWQTWANWLENKGILSLFVNMGFLPFFFSEHFHLWMVQITTEENKISFLLICDGKYLLKNLKDLKKIVFCFVRSNCWFSWPYWITFIVVMYKDSYNIYFSVGRDSIFRFVREVYWILSGKLLTFLNHLFNSYIELNSLTKCGIIYSYR